MELRSARKTIIRGWVSIMLVLFSGLAAVAAGGEAEMIRQANAAYSAGQYEKASELYQKVVTAGYAAPGLYYNLGNAFFKLNDMPHAILWYERARRLDPGNEDIDFNLNVANSKIADKIDAVPEMFYRRWFFTLVNLLPADTWAWWTVIAVILALAGGTLYVVSRTLLFRKAGFWSGLVFLAAALFLFWISYWGHSQVSKVQEAILFTPTVTVKSSPDEKSVDLFVLHEGTKVQLMDQIGTWYEIRIANGSVGWLPSTSLEKI
jgi:tetratricopeptide (TPR) repeat protein